MKKMKKLIGFSLALISAATITLPSSASAGTHFGTFGFRLTSGVGDWGNSTQYYWIDSSASGETSRINDSMSAWVHTGHILSTPISFRKTTNKPSSVMDIYKRNYFPYSEHTLGIARFYKSGSEVKPYEENYSWTKILINAPNYNEFNDFYKRGTLAHEMGHAFGLAHNNAEGDSIMCQLDSGEPGDAKRYVNTPDLGSLYGINSLY